MSHPMTPVPEASAMAVDALDFDSVFSIDVDLDDPGAAMAAGSTTEEAPSDDAAQSSAMAVAAGARWSGPDVSDHQPSVNWGRVASSGHRLAVAKATEGLTWRSKVFPARWKAMQDAGLVRGAYHFARPQPGRSGRDEAEFFLSVVDDAGGFRPGDLRPVLDLEAYGPTPLGAAQTLRWAHEFAREVKEHVGRLPIIYTGAFWRDAMGNPDSGLGCHLWLAAYVNDPTPFVPRAWRATGWSIWQHTSSGTCPGIPGRCDLNVTRNRDVLAKLRLPAGDRA